MSSCAEFEALLRSAKSGSQAGSSKSRKRSVSSRIDCKRRRADHKAASRTGRTVSLGEACALGVIAAACSFLISAWGCSTQFNKQAGSVPGFSQKQISAVSGEWQMEITAGPSITYGVAYIKSDHSTVYGHGHDPAGNFQIQGTLSSNQIGFVKRYDEAACQNGAHRQDIVFHGLLSAPAGANPLIEGKYETQVKSGFPTSYFQKSQWQTISGRWSARKIAELPPELSLQMDNRQASWNPLRDLDAQPAQANQPVVVEPAQNANEGIAFYSLIAAAVVGAFGWLLFLMYRGLKSWASDGAANSEL
jgi:hypothetical protein